MKRSTAGFKSVLAFDLRGLALLRFGLGLIIVIDLVNRLRSFGAHYGSAGVLPREIYFAEFEEKWHISLHLFSSSDAVTLLLFAVAIIAGLMLAIGYRTRVATIASWLLLISLHSRNPLVLQGGDEILRALLFWGMFLPLGARFSVDRALAKDHDTPPTEPFVSMATLCLVGQVVLLYAFATTSKLMHPVWWRDGLGVYFSLGVEQFTTRFGLMLRGSAGLLTMLNWLTLFIQGLTPVLLLLPLGRNLVRTVLPLTMIGLHAGFALSMELGLFSYIVIVMWLAFLAPAVLDRIERRLPDLGPWLRTKRDALRPNAAPTAAPAIEPIANPIYKGLLATLLVYLLWWNLAGLDKDIFRMPTSMRSAAQVLRLEQRWRMFSNPPRWTQWFIVSGVRDDGSEIDLRTGEPPQYDKPELVSATFATQRWRKYLNNIAAKQGSPHRRHFGAYTCRRWNANHPDQRVDVVRVTIMRQATPHRPGLKRTPPDRVVLGSWRCDDATRAP